MKGRKLPWPIIIGVGGAMVFQFIWALVRHGGRAPVLVWIIFAVAIVFLLSRGSYRRDPRL